MHRDLIATACGIGLSSLFVAGIIKLASLPSFASMPTELRQSDVKGIAWMTCRNLTLGGSSVNTEAIRLVAYYYQQAIWDGFSEEQAKIISAEKTTKILRLIASKDFDCGRL